MNPVLCAACGDQHAEWPLLICHYDRDNLHQGLTDLAHWYDAMLLPPVRGHNGMPQGKNHERPIPISDAITRVRSEILEILLGWAALHHERTGSIDIPAGVETRHTGNINELIEYLMKNEQWLLTQDEEAAKSYTIEVQRLAVLAQRTAAPGRREGVVIAVHQAVVGEQPNANCLCDCHVRSAADGPLCSIEGGCYAEHQQLVACGNVWAKGVASEAIGRCAGCGTRKSVMQWMKLSPPNPNDELTDDQVVSYFAIGYGQVVAQRTIRTWRRRYEQLRDGSRKRGSVTVTQRRAVDDFATERGWSELRVS